MIKNVETNVLHKIREHVMKKFWNVKTSHEINTILKTSVEIKVYLENILNSKIFCLLWISSHCSLVTINLNNGDVYKLKVLLPQCEFPWYGSLYPSTIPIENRTGESKWSASDRGVNRLL